MRAPLHPVWRDYRNRQRAVLLAVAALLIARGTGLVLDGWSDALRIATSALLTASIAAVVWFASFRCPFCANHFHWTWLVSNPVASRCLHCGFERLRDPEAGRAYSPRR